MSEAFANPFSPAQLFGYLALALGLTAFWQRDDRRFRILMTLLSASYGIHFYLLGNYVAMVSSLLSVGRSYASIHTRSPWVAGAFCLAFAIFGGMVMTTPQQLLPIAGAIVGTLSMFLLNGIAMRSVLLFGTGLWLANNYLSGSIGGVALETTNGLVNIANIARLLRARRRAGISRSPC